MLLEDGTRRYVWGLGLAYEVESGSALVYHTDGLGSIRAITNNSSAVIQAYATDEFGALIATSGSSNQPFSFTGEQHDPETALVYLRGRYLDPMSGRFMSRDRLVGSVSRPQSMHRYVYVSNSPCSYTDPSGMMANKAVSGCGDPPEIPGVPSGFDAPGELARNMDRASHLNNLWELIDLVKPGGEWDWKFQWGSDDYQDFGNFHFGVVSAAYGLYQYQATVGAGGLQVLQAGTDIWNERSIRTVHGLPPGVIGPPFLPVSIPHPGIPPYGDDTRDYDQILKGYRYFEWFQCVNAE